MDTAGKTTSIVVIADVHYGEHSDGNRRCSIADILLERAVRRINDLIRPDVALVLGDLVDNGDLPGAEERLQTLRSILDKLDCPYLAIPGNHDGSADQFYRVFPRPEPVEEIGGARFLAFVDREEPGYNASRSEADIDRIRMAGAENAATPLVTLQHVCLFPPEHEAAPYNYTNVPEIIGALKQAGATLSVSGHHHAGGGLIEQDGVHYVNAPGLCEAPFPLLEITIDGGSVTTRRHELAMPAELKLDDNHLHTQLAYCSQNMTVAKAIDLAREFGLAGITFSEHSGQLYFATKDYWRNKWLKPGIAAANDADSRMAAYLELKEAYEDDFARFSLEADCDVRGNLLLQPADRDRFGPVMGTIHALPRLSSEAPPVQRDLDDFLYLVDAMGKQGIRILAHPLRIFARAGWGAPPALYEPTAKLLREHGVAAEINFHGNRPPVGFVRCCLDHGVKFSFGSDSHLLSEIGDFAYNIALLRQAGFDGDPADILI